MKLLFRLNIVKLRYELLVSFIQAFVLKDELGYLMLEVLF